MTRYLILAWLVSALAMQAAPQRARAEELITLNGDAPAHAFTHFWEKMFGSGRAILSLRESYRQDLRAVVGVTGAEYVRFHAIFHDELGVYDEDAHGTAIYNFSYVDQVYDGLLASGVRPMVEISFMPRKLAQRAMRHPFWYAPDVSPPKDYVRWDALITAFARHLIERYGIDEVSRWYFEVWNEPNLDFWGGRPAQTTYWQLYDHTARALKAVDARLRVGGPATAQAAWIPDFIRHCAEHGVPVDFVSTHVYANDTAENVFATHERIPRDQFVCRAVRKVHDEIGRSARPTLPLIWSEFNASFKNETAVTDAAYMGPWLAETARQCDGLVDAMAYWTFSDVFEEQGVVKTPFHGGFGLIAAGGIPKPAYNAFALLHQLGTKRLETAAESALFTRRADGALVLALWNYAAPGASGEPRSVDLRLRNSAARVADIVTLDPLHGDPGPTYEQMGRPRSPTQAQIALLKRAAELPDSVSRPLDDGHLALTIPAHGLVLITFR